MTEPDPQDDGVTRFELVHTATGHVTTTDTPETPDSEEK